MNTKQIQYVLAIIREGSFSKAADALHISQPSLSQYIKKIEKEIGLDLFDRINGDVRLTDAGRVYIDAGRKILDIEHQMENSLSDLAENRTGSLIIGSAPYRAASMIPVIAAAFRKNHPGIHLVVREGTTAELVEGMEHGEYDFALTLLPLDKSLFSYEKVVEEELILAVPGFFPAFRAENIYGRKYPAVSAEVLNGQNLVMLTETQFMQKQLDNLVKDYHLDIKPASIVKSLQAQIEMVKAGVGLALEPSGIERFCKDNEVRFYSFVDPLPKREVVIMWRKDRNLSKVALELKAIIHSVSW